MFLDLYEMWNSPRFLFFLYRRVSACKAATHNIKSCFCLLEECLSCTKQENTRKDTCFFSLKLSGTLNPLSLTTSAVCWKHSGGVWCLGELRCAFKHMLYFMWCLCMDPWRVRFDLCERSEMAKGNVCVRNGKLRTHVLLKFVVWVCIMESCLVVCCFGIWKLYYSNRIRGQHIARHLGCPLLIVR